MALPLVYFAAVALVALIVANAIALPAGKLTRFLAFFAVGRTLTAAPLTFSPLILNLYTAFYVQAYASDKNPICHTPSILSAKVHFSSYILLFFHRAF